MLVFSDGTTVEYIMTAFVFVLFVTGAWKKSYTTAFFTLGIPFAYCVAKYSSPDIGVWFILLVNGAMLGRAIILKRKDRFYSRRKEERWVSNV